MVVVVATVTESMKERGVVIFSYFDAYLFGAKENGITRTGP